MKSVCPIHGEYYLALPECPECIRARMKFADGDDPKHQPVAASTVTSFKSFRSDQISTTAIFDYMTKETPDNASGCALFFNKTHQTFTAISREPLNKIPGSGARGGTAWEAPLAVLMDVQGKSAKGPHFSYEEIPFFEKRVQSGELVEAPKCAKCKKVYVYINGSFCPACTAELAAPPTGEKATETAEGTPSTETST